MKNNDYNIEFCHMYSDEHFGDSQIKSIEIYKRVAKKLTVDKKQFVSCVLIDDYHAVNSYINKKAFISEISKYNVDIDFLGYESKIIPIADKLMKILPKELLNIEMFQSPLKEVLTINTKVGNIGLREKHLFSVRHTCAIISTAWTLARLGLYSLNKNQITSISKKKFSANNTVTILPEKYKKVEDKVLEIIKLTQYKKYLKNIHYEFY